MNYLLLYATIVCVYLMAVIYADILDNSQSDENKLGASPFERVVGIPARPPGWILGGGSLMADVIIEAALDLNCVDSGAAWPVLKQLAVEYPPTHVTVIIHIISLPYHSFAFTCSEGFYMVEETCARHREDYVNILFNNSQHFLPNITRNLNEDQIIGFLAPLVENKTGISQKEFTEKITTYRTYAQTTWKYMIKRGVAGTPWYFVNGVQLNSNIHVSLNQWRTLIEDIRREQGRVRHSEADSGHVTGSGSRTSGVDRIVDVIGPSEQGRVRHREADSGHVTGSGSGVSVVDRIVDVIGQIRREATGKQ